MRCVAIEAFGGREQLKLRSLPLPELKPEEILLRVVAAGVNPVDWKIRQGLLQGRLPHQFPLILGWDAAGVVERIGAKVTRFKKGDAVMTYARKPIIQWGTYAEFVAVPEENCAPKPKTLSFEQAAALPLAGLTAYQALFTAACLREHETVLIHAGAGGVGHFALQLAHNIGAKTITTASKTHHEFVGKLGTDIVIDYTRRNFVKSVLDYYPDGIDVVFDTVGNKVQAESLKVLKPGGRLVSILAIPQKEQWEAAGYKVYYVFVSPNAGHLEHLHDLVGEGSLAVHLSETYLLEEAALAHEQIETGHTQGKLALTLE